MKAIQSNNHVGSDTKTLWLAKTHIMNVGKVAIIQGANKFIQVVKMEFNGNSQLSG